MREGRSGVNRRQDARSEVKMVRAYDEEVHGCLRCERLDMDGLGRVEVGRRSIRGS